MFWALYHYENPNIFQFVSKNLKNFIGQIQSNQPIFQVETVLSAPEIVLLPPASELYKLLLQTVRDTVEW